MSGQPTFARPPFQAEFLQELATSLRHESGTAIAGSSTITTAATTTTTTTTTAATTTSPTTHKRKREETQQPHSSPLKVSQGEEVRRAGYNKRVATGNNNPHHSGMMIANDTSGESHGNDSAVPPSGSFMSGHPSPSQQGELGEDETHHRRASATSIEFNSIAHEHHRADSNSTDSNNNNNHHNNHEQNSTQQNGASNPSNATATAAAALAGIFPTMTVPQPTFGNSAAAGDPDRNIDPSFGLGDNEGGQHQHALPNFDLDDVSRRTRLPQLPTIPPQSSTGGGSSSSNKPIVGSEEWHRVRRDNHKEVERRRRETINEGINELAKIVPGCEKNKGSILQRAVSFITQLKENEAQNIEKWTLEKLLTEQAITELSASNDKYKSECERAWREAEHWKKMCEEAGLISPKGDVGVPDDNNATKDGGQ